MRQRLRQIAEILNHPANRAHRLTTLLRYVKWNFGRRLLNEADYFIHITPTAKVILSNRENYATLAYTCGLYDFDEMTFLLDYLQPEDVFGDFGANVGVYSVLAASKSATVLSVEPVPNTFERLQENLLMNGAKGQAIQCGLADATGKLKFTKALGGLNRVATSRDTDTIEVDVLTIDELVKRTGLSPTIIKIDVEGFELPLLRGSTNLLPNVAAIIIELNDSSKTYGDTDDEVHAFLVAAGFLCCDYVPSTRALRPRSDFHRHRFNSLYLNQRLIDDTRSRLETQRA